MYINSIVKGQTVEFTKGDYKGEQGTFKAITGYTDLYGCVCKIKIAGEEREFTSDFFEFTKQEINAKWADDSYDFKLERN